MVATGWYVALLHDMLAVHAVDRLRGRFAEEEVVVPDFLVRVPKECYVIEIVVVVKNVLDVDHAFSSVILCEMRLYRLWVIDDVYELVGNVVQVFMGPDNPHCVRIQASHYESSRVVTLVR